MANHSFLAGLKGSPSMPVNPTAPNGQMACNMLRSQLWLALNDNFYNAKQQILYSPIDSTSTDTGALVIVGGLGVGKNITAGSVTSETGIFNTIRVKYIFQDDPDSILSSNGIIAVNEINAQTGTVQTVDENNPQSLINLEYLKNSSANVFHESDYLNLTDYLTVGNIRLDAVTNTITTGNINITNTPTLLTNAVRLSDIAPVNLGQLSIISIDYYLNKNQSSIINTVQMQNCIITVYQENINSSSCFRFIFNDQLIFNFENARNAGYLRFNFDTSASNYADIMNKLTAVTNSGLITQTSPVFAAIGVDNLSGILFILSFNGTLTAQILGSAMENMYAINGQINWNMSITE